MLDLTEVYVGSPVLARERFKLDFRADFFNIMNHGNFNTVTVDSTSSTFGQVTAFTSPRIIQFAMKFIF